jgi:ribosome-associated toxin RatA of RatAB toxin-antitoxin module
MKSIRPRLLIAAAILLFASLTASAAVKQVPPPKDQQELEKMLAPTFNQHILPEGGDPAQLERVLSMGQTIFFFEHSKTPGMTAAGILINAPPEKVWEVIFDHAHYPEFVPMNDGIQVHKLWDNAFKEDLHLNIKLAFISYKMDYSLYSYRRSPYRQDWTLASGEFDSNLGFWELIPTADGKRTMAFEALYSEPRSRLLKSLYASEPSIEMMTNVSTAVMMEQAIKKETEKRMGVRPGPTAQKTRLDPVKILEAEPKTMMLLLERGNLVILEDGPTVYAIGGGIVNVPPAKAYAVITDFKDYPQFVPGVKKAELVSSAKGADTYKWNLEYDLAFIKYTDVQQWQYSFAAPEYVSWQIARPCCGPATGFWKLVPKDNKTIMFYGTTGDIRSLGQLPKYALKVEPTLEYAAFTSESLLVVNSMKKRIQEKALPH